MASVGESSKPGGPSPGGMPPVVGAPEAQTVELDSEGKQAGPNKQRWTPREALKNMIRMKKAGRTKWWQWLKPVLSEVSLALWRSFSFVLAVRGSP